jgi:hypothetical protein
MLTKKNPRRIANLQTGFSPKPARRALTLRTNQAGVTHTPTGAPDPSSRRKRRKTSKR